MRQQAAGHVERVDVAALAARALGIHAFGILILVHAFAEAVKDLAGFQSWQVVLHYGTHPMKEGNLPLFQRVLRFSLMLDLIGARSEEHTSELQSLMRISYAVFCLKKKQTQTHQHKK